MSHNDSRVDLAPVVPYPNNYILLSLYPRMGGFPPKKLNQMGTKSEAQVSSFTRSIIDLVLGLGPGLGRRIPRP